MYATITMWSVNNKPCIQTTNLKLLTYKTYATKKTQTRTSSQNTYKCDGKKTKNNLKTQLEIFWA
jgi:hypothetical protein